MAARGWRARLRLGHGRDGARRPPAPFVVGVGRSGTTLLRLMLDSHLQLAIPPETHFLPDLIAACGRGADADELVELLRNERHWGDFHLDVEELRARLREAAELDAGEAARAFYSLYADKQGKPRWGDKTPKYLLQMRRIERALPEARFIHLVRDGRDVALSRIREAAGRGGVPPVERVARLWTRRIERARRQAGRVQHYLELRYEDLVADTEATLRRVCDFVELDWDPAMLDYHERAGERLQEMARTLPGKEERQRRPAAHRMGKHALTAEPPRRERVAVWRTEMEPQDRISFELIAGPLLTELGYPIGEEL